MEEIQCPRCKFVTDPASAAVNGNACPQCQRPYAHQPSPLHSEMELRNMPGDAASGQDDMGGNPLKEGILADGGWKNRQKRDESFASVRTAEFMLPGQEEQSDLGFNTASPTHKFIVTGDGSVFDSPEPTTHEEIAQHLGDTEAHLRHGALGQLFSNRNTDWFSNGTGLEPQELQEALSAHYGYPVQVDPSHPNLGVRTQEGRFGLGDLGRGRRELDILNGPALPRPLGKPPIPGEQEWALRGGKTAAEPDLQIPMETEAIGLPGQVTEDVVPGREGLHGEVLGALNSLGAYVNGRKIDAANDPEYVEYLKTHFSGAQPPANGEEWGWPGNQGKPVMLAHYDPERFNLAKKVVQAGSAAPLQEYAQQQEAGHPLNLRIPNGITDNLHLALGNLRSWVENPYENGQLRPYYNEYHNLLRPALNNREAIRVGVAEPTMGEILNHVAQTDDITPLYEYRGIQRQSHVKTAGPAIALAPEAIGALAEGGAAAAGAGAAEGAGAAAAGGAGAAAEGAGADAVGGAMNGAMGEGAATEDPGLLQRAQSYGGRYLQFEGMHSLLNRGNGGTAGAPAGGYGGGGGAAPVQDAGYYARTADYETPTSHDEIPRNEDGDSNQKNDGDNQAWQKDYDVNGMGGTDSASAPQFDGAGAGMERFMALLPLLMHYFTSPESGAHDPLLQGLDQSLEQEIPGYKDHGNPDAAHQLLMMIIPGGDENDGSHDNDLMQDTKREETGVDEPDDAPVEKESRVDFLPHLPTLLPPKNAFSPPTPNTVGLGNPAMVPGGMSPNSPTVRGHCPHCGAITDPSNATCPQCGAAISGMPNHQDQSGQLQASTSSDCTHCGSTIDPGEECVVCEVPHTAAGHQGPHTPEQISAVQQLLMDQGRLDEVPDVPLYPQNYAEELAQITNSDNPPQVDDSQGGQPEPAVEEAPPGDTMPVPGMSVPQQMSSAVARYAADSVSNACPECGSHTTRLIGDDGESECHNCGNTFKSDVKLVSLSPKAADVHEHSHPNFQGVPAADQERPEDPSQEQDASHHWADSNGEPLKVGNEYEMYTANYDIPDIVLITSVKPNEIEYELTGEYGLTGSKPVSWEEAQIEQYRFVPETQDHNELQPETDNIELNNDDNTGYTGPGETDLSRPHALVSSATGSGREWLLDGVSPAAPPLPPVVEGNSGREWLMDGASHTAGAKLTPMEQRAFIEEAGVARNADKLDLTGTHYEAAVEDEDLFLFGL